MATTFAGAFKNPTDDFAVIDNPNGAGYVIGVKTYCECGSACCSRPQTGFRAHTNEKVFDDPDDAYEYIEALRERAEEQYDEYLEMNHDAIVQMERYEMFLAER